MRRVTFAVLSLATALGLMPAAAQEAQGPREGIKVHGHWVIDIKGADGTLVSHREFENALLPPGKLALSHLLARRSIAGIWKITLTNNGPDPSPCGVVVLGGLQYPRYCEISEAQAVGTESTNLVVSPSTTAPTLTLAGSVQASGAGVVENVYTELNVCDPAPGSTCTGFVFSGTPISPITIAKDQIVQVSVTFSFS